MIYCKICCDKCENEEHNIEFTMGDISESQNKDRILNQTCGVFRVSPEQLLKTIKRFQDEMEIAKKEAATLKRIIFFEELKIKTFKQPFIMGIINWNIVCGLQRLDAYMRPYTITPKRRGALLRKGIWLPNDKNI